MQLSVRDLTVTTPGGARLLELNQLDAMPGTALGVRGASGAGKSTFLQALMGLADGARGEVIWGGTDLLGLTEPARDEFRRRHMGMVFQDFLLFDELAAQDNAAVQAMFAPRREREVLARRAHDLLKNLDVPDQGRDVAQLSGGERQRVAVARALAHDPLIVLADEPTASLDRETGDALAGLLVDRATERGITLIVASHDERLLERMDRVLVLDHGRPVDVYA